MLDGYEILDCIPSNLIKTLTFIENNYGDVVELEARKENMFIKDITSYRIIFKKEKK